MFGGYPHKCSNFTAVGRQGHGECTPCGAGERGVKVVAANLFRSAEQVAWANHCTERIQHPLPANRSAAGRRVEAGEWEGAEGAELTRSDGASSAGEGG
jgi:hypothetical protein